MYDYEYNDKLELWAELQSAIPGNDNFLFNSLSTNALSDFQSDRGDLTQATFKIAFSTKLWSGSRRNVEKGYQDIKQLLAKSHPE